eukprot:1159526-Pelagomonas_calceolata.AAC.4
MKLRLPTQGRVQRSLISWSMILHPGRRLQVNEIAQSSLQNSYTYARTCTRSSHSCSRDDLSAMHVPAQTDTTKDHH